ncbi:MAG: aldehyde dehydrogenase family protein, partial [Acidimicrobiia bacterium]
MNPEEVFQALGIEEHNSGVYAGEWLEATGETIDVINPTTGQAIATVTMASRDDYERVVEASAESFEKWRRLPPPKRGEYIRLLGNALRENIDALGALVTLENGKIHPEG